MEDKISPNVNTVLRNLEKPTTIKNNERSKVGLIVASVFGAAGLAIVALTTPFILPALRKHCLPYVPATDQQLSNLSKAFKKHSKRGDSFLDIGSGDGRICRLGAQLGLFSHIHGVELNYMLVTFSRLVALRLGQSKFVKYHHRDLWRFPLGHYDAICIFGVESMMGPLEGYIKSSNSKPQTIYACRFPFENMPLKEEIGEGIDTVWVYQLHSSKGS